MQDSELFKPGVNCWQTGKADKAAFLIDCADYYRTLYEALCRARHSIFVLGWDIDSRIELLRGEDAEGKDVPVSFFDLIQWKARENPDLKIYLNKWNYSVFFVKEREPFSGIKWHMRSPENVHFCSDYKIPLTACHHQKVIVVDDALAFCGGMDIALGRWDRRQHRVCVEERTDPGGILRAGIEKPYSPYHDIQFMMSGPVVRPLSELVRERWKRGAGYDAIPVRKEGIHDGRIWPENVKPDFRDIELAVARTIPRTRKSETVREILHAYLDEISRATKFIYIENQYLTCKKIAQALNRQMKKEPDLRVLAVSCDVPRGLMEHKAMWTGRVDFCDIASEGIEPGRFAVAYPVSKENGEEKTIHIHSKIMVVDDRYFHVGSSNLNQRSMGFDTECDVIIEGRDEQSRSRIAAIRNNLIREHTGWNEQDIAQFIESGAPAVKILEYQDHSRQHLMKINNEPYRNDRFASFGIKIGDPFEAKVLINMPVRQTIGAALVAGFLIMLLWAWLGPAFSQIFSEDSLTGAIREAQDSNWGFLWIVAVYIMAGAVFFPVTVLNLTTAVVFGPVYGIIMSLLGSVSSATVSYAVGWVMGEKALRLFRPIIEKIRGYAQKGGILGMSLVRLVPMAPFTAVNLTFGISRIPFFSYIAATVFGLLPGIFAKAMFGGALGQLWEHPEPRVIFFAVGSLLLWISIIWASHRVFRHYQLEMKL